MFSRIKILTLLTIFILTPSVLGIENSKPHIAASYGEVYPSTVTGFNQNIEIAVNLEGLGGKIEDLDPNIKKQLQIKPLDVVLVIDKSGSMEANDYYPTRLLAAKSAAKSFIENLEAEDKVAVVSFTGYTTVESTFSNDKYSLNENIDNIYPVWEGTAIGDGLIKGLELLDDSGRENSVKAIILLSDGSSNAGTSVSVATSRAIEAGIPVYTVGIGSEEGTYLKGQYIDFDEETLIDIAEDTGGEYNFAANENDLRKIYEELTSKTSNIAGLKVKVEIEPSAFFETNSDLVYEFDTIPVGKQTTIKVNGHMMDLTPNGRIPVISNVKISYLDAISEDIIEESLGPLNLNLERSVVDNLANIQNINFVGRDVKYTPIVYKLNDEIDIETQVNFEIDGIESIAYVYDDFQGNTLYDNSVGSNGKTSVEKNGLIYHSFEGLNKIGSYTYYESLVYNKQLLDYEDEKFYVVFDVDPQLIDFTDSTKYYRGFSLSNPSNFESKGIVELHPKSDEILSHANSIVSGSTNKYYAAKKLAHGINGNLLMPSEITNGQLSDYQILTSKKGDSADFTALYISLVRSLNIPARGVRITGKETISSKTNQIQHSSAEVFIDGRWIPADSYAMTFDDTDVFLKNRLGRNLEEVQVKVEYNPGVETEDFVSTLKYGVVGTGPFSSNEVIVVSNNQEKTFYLTLYNALEGTTIENIKIEVVDENNNFDVQLVSVPNKILPENDATIEMSLKSVKGLPESKSIENLYLIVHYEASKDGKTYGIDKEYTVRVLLSKNGVNDLEDIKNDQSDISGGRIVADPIVPLDPPAVVIDTAPGFSSFISAVMFCILIFSRRLRS